MFRKLVSNLSFSPGVANQLGFYARRLRGEDLTRKLSMVFGVGVLAFQLVAIVVPAQSINAEGPSNIFGSGFASKGDLINKLAADPSAKSLFDYLGIGAGEINAARDTYIPAQGNSILSFGRYANSVSTAVTVNSQGDTFYARPLSSVAVTPNAHVLEGTTTTGQYFAVLFTCGNPVVYSLPAPPSTPAPAPAPPAPIPTAPSLQLTKTTIPGMPVAGSTVRPGDLIGYRVYFSNTGNAAANNVFVEDSTPRQTSFTIQGTGGADRYGYLDTVYPGHSQEPHVYWAYYNFPAGATNYYVDFQVKVNTGVNDGEQICNTAFIRSAEAAQRGSNQICHTIKVTAPPPAVTPPATIPPPTVTPPATPTPTSPPVNTPVVSPNIQLSKSAVYTTHNGQASNRVNADTSAGGPAAVAGDVIEYTLNTLNSGDGAQKGQPLIEDVHDILEYATLTNPGAGTYDPKTGKLYWGTVDIPAHTTITRVFSVTVKSPIPATPQSSSDKYSFDLTMDNLYGNKVTVKIVPPTPAAQIAVTSQQLPATGAGLNLTIVGAVAALLVYFYSRNRLMIREVAILRVDHNPGV